MTIQSLDPKPVWKHFADISAIPRPSKKEEKIIAFMRDFGLSIGLQTHVDEVGNVIIKKPASRGMENRQTVILQSHLDMVHQKNNDTVFDFATEGIRAIINNDWVVADGTTLGADNGIGVASIMAILTSDNIVHPPIEALFTIDEETGMTGAKGLDQRILDGSILLNLDSEEDDEITIGCAGGVNTTTKLSYNEEPVPDEHLGYEVIIGGLKGGHSGIEIHIGRGNANKLLIRLLYKAYESYGVRLASFDGGGLRNAIPREAHSVFTVPSEKTESFTAYYESFLNDIQAEFQSIEPHLKIILKSVATPEKVMAILDQQKALASLYAVHNGVFRMTPEIKDLVETSSNLARVEIKGGNFSTLSLQRSSSESGKGDIAKSVRAAFELIGATVENDGDYPGWAPNRQSNMLKVVEDTYEALFGEKPHVAACHAGVECGIIGNRYPGLDMVSIGPTIKHPHSPDEKVSISSVQKFWKLLLEVLKNTPEK